MASSGEKTDTTPPQKHPEYSGASHTETENPTLDGGGSGDDDDGGPDEETRRRLEATARLENPLRGLPAAELARRGAEYCARHGITDEADVRAFRLGAVIAGQAPGRRHDGAGVRGEDGEDGEELTAGERAALGREVTHKWHNPAMLYAVIAICSLCAAVQGMDETVVNGAQYFYRRQFGIGDQEAARGKFFFSSSFFLAFVLPRNTCAVSQSKRGEGGHSAERRGGDIYTYLDYYFLYKKTRSN